MSLARRQRRRPSGGKAVVLVIVGVAAVGAFAVSTDVFGSGQLFGQAVATIDGYVAAAVPGQPTHGTIPVTPAPVITAPSVAPSATPRGPGESSSARPEPTPGPSPTPARVSIDLDIAADPKAAFAHELKDTWCAPAGVQMTLALLGLGDTSHEFQRELQGRVHEWESYGDSHNGRWGPSAMALALEAYGAPGYEVRGYETREAALRDAAVAIEATRSPVVLLAWRGAHTWVMTGFRADADPQRFLDATVEGAYILDPWYPWVSSIWGPSDPPGTFQDSAEMERNYLRWKRPEGHYPKRDGLFIAVVPTLPVPRP